MHRSKWAPFFTVSSTVITKPIGDVATTFPFEFFAPVNDISLGCDCVGVGGWKMTPKNAVDFDTNNAKPFEVAWLTLAQITSYT